MGEEEEEIPSLNSMGIRGMRGYLGLVKFQVHWHHICDYYGVCEIHLPFQSTSRSLWKRLKIPSDKLAHDEEISIEMRISNKQKRRNIYKTDSNKPAKAFGRKKGESSRTQRIQHVAPRHLEALSHQVTPSEIKRHHQNDGKECFHNAARIAAGFVCCQRF